MSDDMKHIILANMNVKLYSWPLTFRKVVRQHIWGEVVVFFRRSALTQSEIPKIPNRCRDILKYRQQIPNRLEKIPTGIPRNRYRLEIPTPTRDYFNQFLFFPFVFTKALSLVLERCLFPSSRIFLLHFGSRFNLVAVSDDGRLSENIYNTRLLF